MITRIVNKLKRILRKFNYKISKRKINKFSKNLSFNEVQKINQRKNEQYSFFHHYFWNLSPDWLKAHRAYFSIENRSYGEDAFHAMWYFLFKEFKPKNILEIGVYRGSTLSLFSLLSVKFNLASKIHGISPFSSAGDSVSNYLNNIDYLEDVKNNFVHFNLPPPTLHEGFSTDKEMIEIMGNQQWDLIFIDGNHDYEVVKADFNVCSQNLRKGGLIVLDDASLYTDYKPSSYSTAGHPGPSKFANEISPNEFLEILAVGHNRVFRKI